MWSRRLAIIVKVRFQEWSEQEIAEACFFKVLVDRVYRTFQTRKGGGKYASKKWMKFKDGFGKWQEAFREEIIEALKINMLQSRGKIELVERNRGDYWDKGTYMMEHFYIKSWMDTLIPVIICLPER